MFPKDPTGASHSHNVCLTATHGKPFAMSVAMPLPRSPYRSHDLQALPAVAMTVPRSPWCPSPRSPFRSHGLCSLRAPWVSRAATQRRRHSIRQPAGRRRGELIDLKLMYPIRLYHSCVCHAAAHKCSAEHSDWPSRPGQETVTRMGRRLKTNNGRKT